MKISLMALALALFAAFGCGSGGAPDGGPDSDADWGWTSIPKDRLIFLANRRNPGTSPPEIYLFEKTGEITLLVGDTYHNYNPSLAPSGLEIAFHRQLGGSFATNEIITHNIASGQETRITNNSVSDVAPKWSPDSTKLVFASWSDNGVSSPASNIFVVDTAGHLTQLTYDSDRENLDPAWCGPDRIVFKSSALAPNDCREQIYLINADGSGGLRQLSAQSGWQSDHDPRCTPDGSTVFFYRYEATRRWKDLADITTLSQNWQDFYPVNVWTNSTSGQPGDQRVLTACVHSCTGPVPANPGIVGFLHQDFITDASNHLIGSSTYFMVMDADGTHADKLLPDHVYADYISTLEYWDW